MVESIWPCIETVSAFFCHVRGLKQREQASSEHVVTSIAIYKKKATEFSVAFFRSMLYIPGC